MLLERVRVVWQEEPARFVAGVVAAVVFVAARFGVVVDEQSLGAALLIVVPILLGGEVTHQHVPPPTKPLVAPPAPDYRDGANV